ncbi:hypothetical protein IEO21_07691 [Rhodonia placenta]|uniref:Uncharacterized protein n=1 Tax=Rhodonia placenta TaxID=104341 RepID=A0A8H7NXN4_9APHY|nr:hypothetical protein IEO21_07691 [Postia placenta]
MAEKVIERTASVSPASPTVRIVPGAPPPAPPSKAQKKKRKTAKAKSTEPETVDHVEVPDPVAAALIDKAPTEVDVRESSITPSLVAQPEEPQSPVEDNVLKPSPIIDMLNKRLKAIQKKMTRIEAYSSEPPETLNDDQRRLLRTLPGLEAVRKELEEVKKVIATHEAEVAQELASKLTEAVRLERQRLADAVEAAEAAQRQRTAHLLHFLRLRDLLLASHPSVTFLSLSEPENYAVYSATETLLGDDSDSRGNILHGFLTGTGELNGITFSRLHEITQLFLNPPRAPTPEEEALEEQTHEDVAQQAESIVAAVGLPSTLGTTGAFHFMQEDELESTPAEPIVEPQYDAIPKVEQPAEVEVVDTVPGAAAAADSAIDWADEDEGGLPSIGSLHAEFGKPQTPVPNGTVPPTPSVNGAQTNEDAAEAGGVVASEETEVVTVAAVVIVAVVVVIVVVTVAAIVVVNVVNMVNAVNVVTVVVLVAASEGNEVSTVAGIAGNGGVATASIAVVAGIAGNGGVAMASIAVEAAVVDAVGLSSPSIDNTRVSSDPTRIP